METISEWHMLLVLAAILHQYPFRILGFHSDNGSRWFRNDDRGFKCGICA